VPIVPTSALPMRRQSETRPSAMERPRSSAAGCAVTAIWC